jgi:hypothetical protein
VLINVARAAEIALLDRLTPIVGEPFEPRESEELHVDIRPMSKNRSISAARC